MGLVGPYLTTTSYKKRVEKITKAKQEEFERGWRDRNRRLKEMHLPKETFEQYMEFVYGRCKKEKGQTSIHSGVEAAATKKGSQGKYTVKPVGNECFNGPTSTRTLAALVPSLHDWVTGPCSSKPSPTYTGSAMIGIAQMAKSNAVPVFNNDEIINIARMRR